jgi:hypothetical protein
MPPRNNMVTAIIVLIVFALAVVLAGALVVPVAPVVVPPTAPGRLASQPTSALQTCSDASGSCGLPGKTLDPVSDPAYNMKQVAKQSILLEEHIADDKKYCKDCIVKHFLHIIGLAEEAVWLAGDRLPQYPHLRESVAFYNKEFDTWVSNKDDEETRLRVLSQLRDFRKQVISAYF